MSAETLYAAVSRSRDWFWSDAGRHRVGRNDLKAARRQIVALAFEYLGLDEPEIALQLADDFTLERERLVRPFPGAIGTLQELHRRGIQLALVTNGASAFQRAKIDRFDLRRYFRSILIEGEFGVGKPDRAVFEHTLKALDCSPSQAWMVGDSLTFDIEPALDLGMHGIWMDYAGTGLPLAARCVPSKTISALPELLG